jgi:hypothetical protein
MFRVLNPFRAGQEFQRLKGEKKWALALLAVLIPGILSLAGSSLVGQKSEALTMQYTEEQMGTMAEQGQITGEQLEAVRSMQGLFAVIGIVIGFVVIIGAWLVKSVAFHILARIMGGEQVDISSTIHLIAYTYLPLIFKGILDVVNGIRYQPPPYEEFVHQLQNPDVLMDFVRSHGIFFWWSFILMVIAVREQYTLGSARSVFVVLIPYIVLWIIAMFMTSLSSALMGGM